ncbi:MAG: DoxX family protein [Candidatus Marinimicrobia bacterium]|nr:DoxX family protein [Candidatus Neomarinimicrobiota bacterium]
MTKCQNVARIVFAVPFIIFGIMHFMGAGDMSGMVPSFIPGGVFWVYLTGLALILAGVSIIIQKYTHLASKLLAALMLIFVLTIHLPAVIGGDMMAMVSLLKDIALAGGALLIASLYPCERKSE